ncbi:MAG: SH3 domain-containing protein [Anaerolineae bacterium]|jgi:cytoskeletal protein RodZ
MTSSSGKRSSYRGGGGSQELFPKWMWIVVPILVILVLAGIWALLVSDDGEASPEGTVLPTQAAAVATSAPEREQLPTVESSDETVLPELDVTATPTREVLPLKTHTPTPAQVAATPTEAESEAGVGLAVGESVKVVNTGGAGLNMRAGAGTGHAKVKTLAEGATVEIIGGPEEANNYTWWQVRDSGGATGWVVQTYLQK